MTSIKHYFESCSFLISKTLNRRMRSVTKDIRKVNCPECRKRFRKPCPCGSGNRFEECCGNPI